MKYQTKEIYDKYIYCNKNNNGCIHILHALNFHCCSKCSNCPPLVSIKILASLTRDEECLSVTDACACIDSVTDKVLAFVHLTFITKILHVLPHVEVNGVGGLVITVANSVEPQWSVQQPWKC
jgi:hypothetical protein